MQNLAVYLLSFDSFGIHQHICNVLKVQERKEFHSAALSLNFW